MSNDPERDRLVNVLKGAEELARRITSKGYDSCGMRVDLYYEDVLALIEADRAAQRQAGREEAEEHAFDLLRFYGIPKERAHTVVNGIDVLVTRLNREIESERGNRAMEAKRYAAVVEAAMAMRKLLPIWTNDLSLSAILRFDKALSDLEAKPDAGKGE